VEYVDCPGGTTAAAARTMRVDAGEGGEKGNSCGKVQQGSQDLRTEQVARPERGGGDGDRSTRAINEIRNKAGKTDKSRAVEMSTGKL